MGNGPTSTLILAQSSSRFGQRRIAKDEEFDKRRDNEHNRELAENETLRKREAGWYECQSAL